MDDDSVVGDLHTLRGEGDLESDLRNLEELLGFEVVGVVCVVEGEEEHGSLALDIRPPVIHLLHECPHVLLLGEILEDLRPTRVAEDLGEDGFRLVVEVGQQDDRDMSERDIAMVLLVFLMSGGIEVKAGVEFPERLS